MLFLLLLLRGLIWGAPQPGEQDPSLAIRNGSRAPRVLVGRVLADARQFDPGCSVLVEVQRLDGQRRQGRTELQWRQCGIVLRQGWRVRAVGDLRQPAEGVHPFLPGAAERLASRGSWSQLRVSELEVLERPWTPLADARRSIAQRMQRLAGPERGGLLAALVLGGARCSCRTPASVLSGGGPLPCPGSVWISPVGSARGSTVDRSVVAPNGATRCCGTATGGLPAAGWSSTFRGRAVLMGSTAMLIRESGERSRGFGVLLLTLNGMLLSHPAWPNRSAFQPAAATAGLILTAPGLEQALIRRLPQALPLAGAGAVSSPGGDGLDAAAAVAAFRLDTPVCPWPICWRPLAPPTLSHGPGRWCAGASTRPSAAAVLAGSAARQSTDRAGELDQQLAGRSGAHRSAAVGWCCCWLLSCCPGCCRPRAGPIGGAVVAHHSLHCMPACSLRMDWSPSIAVAGTGCWPATTDALHWWSAMQTRPPPRWPAASWMGTATTTGRFACCWIRPCR